jgi:tRNA pseudouridine13 synthase
MKLFIGDIMTPYPQGKVWYLKDMTKASKAFSSKQSVPTGLICGSHALRSKSDSYHIEAPYDDEELSTLRGDRRAAWIWPKSTKTSYDQKRQKLNIEFILPKGAYATTFLEEIGKNPLKPQQEVGK